jgi:hypothetical protein
MSTASAYRAADQRRQNRVGTPPAFDCHVLYSSRHGHECRPRAPTRRSGAMSERRIVPAADTRITDNMCVDDEPPRMEVLQMVEPLSPLIKASDMEPSPNNPGGSFPRRRSRS